MKVRVITSCTGQKAVKVPDQLTMADFRKGWDHVSQREQQLHGHCVKAEAMYTGQQHVRLMRGVKFARQAGHTVEVWIVSAGYGVVPGENRIAPYNATFNDLSRQDFQSWAKELNIERDVKEAIAMPSDLTLVLLGDRYLEAADLARVTEAGGWTWAFCGTAAAKQMPKAIFPIALTQADTTRFKVGMIGLKGEAAARVLETPDGDFGIKALQLGFIKNSES